MSLVDVGGCGEIILGAVDGAFFQGARGLAPGVAEAGHILILLAVDLQEDLALVALVHNDWCFGPLLRVTETERVICAADLEFRS